MKKYIMTILVLGQLFLSACSDGLNEITDNAFFIFVPAEQLGQDFKKHGHNCITVCLDDAKIFWKKGKDGSILISEKDGYDAMMTCG
ncbi:hypothetical protein IC620_07145 [Hazenella sp. IB182357]|uniref:Lipoprotein n=1 Tax=Polycladospora coralii TaxID=2771432 RepID=A0A926RX30_9BACL|nr:hypothetical protein [Polycladospora coralii]MBD1372136.1 hypothetical protein [Polycladospora coralii]MBS7530642.1 hypothetical protein [Polycladospora coralii]